MTAMRFSFWLLRTRRVNAPMSNVNVQSPSQLKLQAAKLEALAEAADLRAQAADLVAQADALEAAVHAPVVSPAPSPATVAAPAVVAPSAPAAAPVAPAPAADDFSNKVLTQHPDGSFTWEPFNPAAAA